MSSPNLPVLDRSVQETLAECERFRILCVGRTGAGKSKLINHVFQIDKAEVSNYKPGKADIYTEFTSAANPRFVLHDSKGFEPVDASTFDVVRNFIIEKSNKSLKLQDRLHAVWLCIKTPTAGARVLETGDEKLLQLVDECKLPAVVVFTQYDKLIRIRKHKAAMETGTKDPEELRRWSENQAAKDFERCVASLQNAVTRLKLATIPKYINVSVTENYTGNISPLVEMTRHLVEEDLWFVWATAQQVDLPLKIEACVTKGMNYYWTALRGGIPYAGRELLRKTLVRVHEDIIACWNFKDENGVLTSDEFKHLMIYVVQDMKDTAESKSSPIEIDKMNDFVTLVTAATASFAPPAAILGLTFLFVKWISNAALDEASDIHRVLIAYTVDLILVLEELFKIALQPKVFGRISWKELEQAFDAYQLTESPSRIHSDIRALVEQRGGLNVELSLIRKGLEALVQQYR
ncbi:hypothetical protein B0H12DRAFT_1130266 [Mycena haematopus]|nr:hypothetical protein B0H12DRAFT_1130266 [Mycena haematopus]